VDTDINRYVLFGFESVAFKGGQRAGRGLILGGNVGANGVKPVRRGTDPNVNICANGRVRMSEGSQLVADALRAEDAPNNPCIFWDVFANVLVGASDLGSPNSGPNPVTLPVVHRPSFPSFTCGGLDFTVEKNQTALMPPGTYRNVNFKDNSTVRLMIGTYTMCSFHTGQDVDVSFRANVRRTGPIINFQVDTKFTISNDTTFGDPEDCYRTWVYVRARDLNVGNDNAINFAKDTTVYGHFYTPTGSIALGNGTNLHGTFWGQRMHSDWDVNVLPCGQPPGPTPTATPSPTPSEAPEPTPSTPPGPTPSTPPGPTPSTPPGPTPSTPPGPGPSIPPTVPPGPDPSVPPAPTIPPGPTPNYSAEPTPSQPASPPATAAPSEPAPSGEPTPSAEPTPSDEPTPTGTPRPPRPPGPPATEAPATPRPSLVLPPTSTLQRPPSAGGPGELGPDLVNALFMAGVGTAVVTWLAWLLVIGSGGTTRRRDR
jgi:hypothetical protein